MSQIDYCLKMWGNAPKLYRDKLFTLQKRDVRIILHADHCAPSKPLFMSMNFLSLYARVKYIFMLITL